MKKTLFISTGLVLLLLLSGCGHFEIQGNIVAESTPTVTAGEAINQEDSLIEAPIPPSNGLNLRFGLLEIIIILGVLVLASLAVGAFFIIRDRTPTSDYPPSTDVGDEKKSVGRLLGFRPSVGALILALIGWAGIFGFGAILLAIGLFLPFRSYSEVWYPALTLPSSILIGANDPRIRLVPGGEDCVIRPISNRQEQLQCEVSFEGSPLAVNVSLEDGTFWSCSADYGGEAVPCLASFGSSDYQTYIVVQSNLGLSQSRYQQLVDETMNKGWGESDWLWLARGIVIVLSFMALILLWRHTGNQVEGRSGRVFILRLAYSAGISLMIFAIGSFLSFILLLAFNLID